MASSIHGWRFFPRAVAFAATLITFVVACSSPSNSSSSSAGVTCPAPKAGNESCGSCGSECYSCATGTCPKDPCTTKTCDGTARCPTTSSNPAHSSYSYCGACATTQQCSYCPAGTCPANPCGTKCDGTGGNGPVGSGGSGGGGGGGTRSGRCPSTSSLQCSQWITGETCNIQSCTCYDNNGNTPFCGMYFHTSDGAEFWCGSAESCSTFNCEAQAKNAVTRCNP